MKYFISYEVVKPSGSSSLPKNTVVDADADTILKAIETIADESGIKGAAIRVCSISPLAETFDPPAPPVVAKTEPTVKS